MLVPSWLLILTTLKLMNKFKTVLLFPSFILGSSGKPFLWEAVHMTPIPFIVLRLSVKDRMPNIWVPKVKCPLLPAVHHLLHYQSMVVFPSYQSMGVSPYCCQTLIKSFEESMVGSWIANFPWIHWPYKKLVSNWTNIHEQSKSHQRNKLMEMMRNMILRVVLLTMSVWCLFGKHLLLL